MNTATMNTALAASESDRALVATVAAAVFAEAQVPPGRTWPPRVAISDASDIGVYAVLDESQDGEPRIAAAGRLEWLEPIHANNAVHAPGPQSAIIVTQGLLDRVAEGRPERLAAALSHAAAHLLLGHVDAARPGELLLSAMISPQQEAQADVLGVQLALAADYPFRSVLACYYALRDHAAGASFEGAAAGHADWAQRIEQLEARAEELWTSIPAFAAGVAFLRTEHFALAEQCFDQVTKEFPRASAAWANLGYAQLMLYCDALEADNLRNYDVGQLVVGGFYTRPDLLRGFRGVLDDVWYDAVGSFRQALILKPDLVLPKAHLAIAYLLHPDGKDVDRAAALGRQVVDALAAGRGEELDPWTRAALCVNVGVVLAAAGEAQQAERMYDEAQAILDRGEPCGPSRVIAGAIRFNRGRLRAASDNPADQLAGVADFEAALNACQRGAAWRALAYEQYAALCRARGLEPRAASEFPGASQIESAAVSAQLTLHGAPLVAPGTLLEPAWAAIAEALDATLELRDVHKKTNIRRLSVAELGIDLLCTERIEAIRVARGEDVLIVLETPDGARRVVGMGMTLSEFIATLPNEAEHWEQSFDGGSAFRFYPRLGLGARFESGAVVELILVAAPR